MIKYINIKKIAICILLFSLTFLVSCRSYPSDTEGNTHDPSSWGIYDRLGSDGLYVADSVSEPYNFSQYTPNTFYDSSDYYPNVYYDSSDCKPSTYFESQDDSSNKSTTEPIVYITDTGEKYHRASCGSLWNSSYRTTPNEAWDLGYTPCSRCDPPLPDEFKKYLEEKYE